MGIALIEGFILLSYINPYIHRWNDMECYRSSDYGLAYYLYHFKGFLIGCVYTTIMALIISGVDYLLLRFVL